MQLKEWSKIKYMESKKKLVWITFNAFIDTDLYIVRELVRYYDITWYVLKSGNDKFEYVKEIDELSKNSGIEVNKLQCGARLRSLSCFMFYKKLLKEIAHIHPDVIYSSLAGAPYFIPVLAMTSDKKKIALAIHNVHVPKGGSAYYFFKLYNSLAIKSFYNYQTFSKDQYNLLKSLIPKKNVCHIPFILKDYGAPQGQREGRAITFLNFGNVREYKRIDVLIEAAQLAFEETNQRFRVIIAGKCDTWDKYQSMIRYPELFELHIERIANENIPELFLEADYFVAPYQDIAQSGSSVVAINYSVPIIASRLPAFEEFIEDGVTGRLIDPADVTSLKQVMVDIIKTNNAGYSEMVKALEEKRNECFSVTAVVNQYKEFINGVAETNNMASAGRRT